MNLNMQRLFDSLKDGILIISPVEYGVLYANQAARAMLPVSPGQPLLVEWMHSQISAIERGFLKPPLTFEISLPGLNSLSDQIQVTLLPSPVGKDFVVILKNISDEQRYENVISNLAEMLDCEFHVPMREFMGSVTQMLSLFEPKAEENWALRESVAEVSRKGASLKGRLQQIGLLASTFKQSPMQGEERIVVPTLINDVLTSTRTLLTEHGIRVSFSGVSTGLPVIYGSRNFLVQALAGYLRYLVERVDRGVNILISAKTKGDFILLSIANYGLSQPPGHSRRVLLPLLGDGETKNIEALSLTLPLCKRVVELCGGNLHFGEDGGVFSKIIFELPVGAPSVEEPDLGMQQAQRYAQDLLTLMQRQSAKPLSKITR
jgi:signal transduction histidine kinase